MSAPTLKQANVIIENAIAHAHASDIKPLAVVVLDASGNIIAAQREDNASMFRLDIALAKPGARQQWAAPVAHWACVPRTILLSLPRWLRLQKAASCHKPEQY